MQYPFAMVQDNRVTGKKKSKLLQLRNFLSLTMLPLSFLHKHGGIIQAQ